MCYWFPKCRPTFLTGCYLVLPILLLVVCTCNLVIVLPHNLHLGFANKKPSILLRECCHYFFGCNIRRTRRIQIVQQPKGLPKQIFPSFSYDHTLYKFQFIGMIIALDRLPINQLCRSSAYCKRTAKPPVLLNGGKTGIILSSIS